jgi:hypothetical protein
MARYKGDEPTQTEPVPVSVEHRLLPGALEFALQVLGE